MTLSEYHIVVQANTEAEALEILKQGIFTKIERHRLRKEWRD
jgi:hypothetical protein|tara:strand:+ start:2334 stop:2459 length:126 start_codon:yes stop_codon:yes gene_type:complete